MDTAVKQGTHKGRPNYPMDFKRRLAIAACAPNVSVSNLALEHEINANMVFKWRRQYRGGMLKTLGEDVSEQLEYVPASFRVLRHVRPKLACACCDRIVQAPAASRPIERGLPGPGLLAHVLVAKYADHVPLYRQSVIYARAGVELGRSLLVAWVGAASALLRPLSEALRRHVFAAANLHADDTPLPVLAPGNGKTRTARL